MTTPFLGEIQVFGFNFAPSGWAFCSGSLVPIQQYSALFALLGVNYGGNGKTNFQLPNFANRAGCNQGEAPGLTPRAVGEAFGENSQTLAMAEMPAHMHQFTIYNQSVLTKKAASPSAGNSLTSPTDTSVFVAAQPNAQFPDNMIGFTGGGQPHENRQPYIAMNYCIAMQGVFPSFG
ncbi:phage tail protein [Mesorhizobium sp. M1A.F.Ca.ET.072.01.1.1]|uniref:phage tail protein n=1 Tax=Mesorhizobium sp. M1A.F.Ca.ET.072.01.1.1 TaxID=2496753 RepID=UPI000FD3E0EB|nr:tail fiber protein [Mesorhizobium sp. M1A.F.Ca.ET.072.01.1.1]RUW46370.1 phage tail protein [Mesorhizobium sp. M1A.F.Ca.ET.072.01.1.1]TIU97630.1 MAG: phage tail protein [Mesorhizobium sp.]